MEKLKGLQAGPLHTSFTLKMQSSVSIHGLLRKRSRVLPAPLMGEQETHTRQLGKGIPGSSTILHCQKATTEKAPESGWLSSLSPLFIEINTVNGGRSGEIH